MARVSDGFATKRQTVTINGLVRPSGPGVVDVTIRVNGVEERWEVADATPHGMAYSAAISAMMDAHEAGVTHLPLQTPANLGRRQATGEWRVGSPALRRMHLLYELFKVDFDDVDWIKGPA